MGNGRESTAYHLVMFLKIELSQDFPPSLQRDSEIEISEALRRDYIEISQVKYIEVNIIGKSKKDSPAVWIIGECKSQVKKKDMDEFLKILKQIEDVLHGEKIPIVVTYQTSPLRQYIKGERQEKGLEV